MSQAVFSTPNDRFQSFNPRWWIAALLHDRAIASSWLCFVAAAVYESYVLSGGWGKRMTVFATRDVFHGALLCGYCAWAFYWAIPPAFVRLRRLLHLWPRGSLAAFILGLFVFVGFAFLFLICYPLLGGAIYHFLRHWYRSAFELHAPRPAPVTMTSLPQPGVPPAAAVSALPLSSPSSTSSLPSDVDRRLQTLARLRDAGVITQQEYDEQRLIILRSI